jgi:hypothetical protein
VGSFPTAMLAWHLVSLCKKYNCRYAEFVSFGGLVQSLTVKFLYVRCVIFSRQTAVGSAKRMLLAVVNTFVPAVSSCGSVFVSREVWVSGNIL